MRVDAKPWSVDERYAHLIETSTDLFLEKGYHETTVRELAAAAGWSMGTLYLFISGKQDVLAMISQAIMQELSEGLLRVAPMPTAWESLRNGVEYYFQTVDRMRPKIRLLYRESATLRPDELERLKEAEIGSRSFFVRIIEGGVAANEFAPISPDFIAHLIITAAHSWPLKTWALRDRFTFAQYLGEYLGTLRLQLRP